MRFDEKVHWADGLFLQPHHLQVMQRSLTSQCRSERSLFMPYTYGLIDFEVDMEAFSNQRLVVKRLTAITPQGQEVSMPGNAVIPSLDLSRILEENVNEATIYLGVPFWSDFEANLADDVDSKRAYSVKENLVRDENTGDNEVSVIVRQVNARLLTSLDDKEDLDLIPLMKVRPLTSETSGSILEIDYKYIPPYVVVTPDCPLHSSITELNFQLGRRRDKMLSDLSSANYNVDMLSGINLQRILQLRSLNVYEARLSTLLGPGRATPHEIYLELRSLLGELAALEPLKGFEDVESYDHNDYAPQFQQICTNIRSLIMAEGGVGYISIPFENNADDDCMTARLKDEHFVNVEDYYIALSCAGSHNQIIRAVEGGDHFKLVNPNSRSERIRGVKLVEMRYPPRFLPVLPDTLWFKLQRTESQRVWRDICDEHAMLIDRVKDLFQNLEATLYITVITEGKSK